MQTRYIQMRMIGRLIFCSLLMLLMSSCEWEEKLLEGGIASDKMIQLSVSMQENTVTKADSHPAKGTYFLSYKEDKAPVIKDIEVGTNGVVLNTGFYWINVTADEAGKNGATFTLSNVTADGKLKQENEYKDLNEIATTADILWANDKKWGTELDFTLKHKMAQVKITFNVDASLTIENVYLKSMGTGITFDRSTGEVTPKGTGDITLLPVKGKDNTYSVLLPPQGRDNTMQLFVKTTDGKSFARTLPTAMSQPIDPTKPDAGREDVPLSFKSGHLLELTAGINDNQDLTILFTGATLEEWTFIQNAIVPARPSGIYTASDLDEWAKAYNAGNTFTNYKLNKYGEYKDDKWTFTLKRNITAKSETTPITSFSDELVGESSCQIDGITKAYLFHKITGTVSDDLFNTK